jgi:hypothetical protein
VHAPERSLPFFFGRSRRDVDASPLGRQRQESAVVTQATFDLPAAPDVDADAQLYRHAKRPEWGIALLRREQNGTRSYQFEDGRVRKIRKGYYKLMEPADDLGERADYIRENLRRMVGADADDSDRTVIEAVCPFAAQVALFTKLYTGGFEDPEWIEDHRRPESGAPLKRHRTPVSSEAGEALSAARFEEMIGGGDHAGMLTVIVDLLASTDLVPVSHAKALKGLEPEEKPRYVESVADLLHGERRYEERLKDHLSTHEELFGERASWRVATALPALVYPQEHAAVRRSAFLRQAGSIAPTARYTKRATVGSYRNFRRIAVRVRDRLKASGHEPRDLLDVHDFVWATLRTSALEHLA